MGSFEPHLSFTSARKTLQKLRLQPISDAIALHQIKLVVELQYFQISSIKCSPIFARLRKTFFLACNESALSH